MIIDRYGVVHLLLIQEVLCNGNISGRGFDSALAFGFNIAPNQKHRLSSRIVNYSSARNSLNIGPFASQIPNAISCPVEMALSQCIGEGQEGDGGEDEEEKTPMDGPVHYDDFDFIPGTNAAVGGGGFVGDMNSDPEDQSTGETPSELSDLFQRSQDEGDARNARVTQNWENGNWKCRGFSLDKFNPVQATPDDADNDSDSGTSSNNSKTTNDEVPTKISQISFDETALGPGFGTTTETVAVGRTDGTVYIVQLGDEYLTKFQAVSKLSMGGNWNDKGDDESIEGEDGDEAPSAKIEMEMINQEDIVNNMGAPVGGTLGSDIELDSRIPMDMSTPFEIECQFQAHERDESITAMLFHDDTLFTSAGGKGKGVIKVWNVSSSSSTGTRMVPLHNLDNVHKDDVVALKTLSSVSSARDVSDHNLLLSASKDGSFALWDMKGDLVYRCELTDDEGNPTSVTCADIDTSSEEHIIYLGLSSGHVVCYLVSDLLGDASEGTTCPVPKCRFLAHDPSLQKNDDEVFRGVTAIACGGLGQMSGSSSSIILLTGGADGVLKQFQMIRQNQPTSNWGLMHWPRLPTQRMKDSAHIFKGHYKAVTALVYDSAEASKILSAGADGTIRVWDPSKTGELYRMDGFEGVNCLCLDRDILVTNGMNEYVCVHDFDVSEDLADSSYDLNW